MKPKLKRDNKSSYSPEFVTGDKQLIDSYNELLAIVNRLDTWHHLENGVFTYTNPNHDGDQLVIDLQQAIYNAGNINY